MRRTTCRTATGRVEICDAPRASPDWDVSLALSVAEERGADRLAVMSGRGCLGLVLVAELRAEPADKPLGECTLRAVRAIPTGASLEDAAAVAARCEGGVVCEVDGELACITAA
ncbi:MAG: hypothetical protein HY908_12465 [Myxococcales bacterium]|nr:hypothetical protein [Myxococcales bacterium]